MVKRKKKDDKMHIKTSNQPELNLGYKNCSCNWGTHFCGLYETDEERDEIIFGFLRQGDIDGDLQLYCPAERSEADFVSRYSDLCDDCGQHVKDTERFQLSSVKDLYYPDGIFSPISMDEGLNQYTISKGVITENPFYQDPDIWLAENAPQFLPSK